jgi:hypothetical protein
MFGLCESKEHFWLGGTEKRPRAHSFNLEHREVAHPSRAKCR